MSNDELRSATRITESTMFHSTGKMSLAIRVFAQVLGDLSPLPFPDARAQILSPGVLSACRLRRNWIGTFTVLAAGAVLSC